MIGESEGVLTMMTSSTAVQHRDTRDHRLLDKHGLLSIVPAVVVEHVCESSNGAADDLLNSFLVASLPGYTSSSSTTNVFASIAINLHPCSYMVQATTILTIANAETAIWLTRPAPTIGQPTLVASRSFSRSTLGICSKHESNSKSNDTEGMLPAQKPCVIGCHC